MFDADEITGTRIQGPHDLFDVRGKLLRKTNPLRTKILIFSTLYRHFDYSDRDWMTLKTQELDGLLRYLFDACPTLNELDVRLHRTARQMQDEDESLNAADLIVRGFAPFYETGDDATAEATVDEDEVSQDFSQDFSDDWTDNTAESDLYGRASTRASVAASADVPPAPPPEALQPAAAPAEDADDSDASLLFGMSADDSQTLPEAPIRSAAKPPGTQPPRLSDRLLQHLATTDEVQDLIRRSSKDLTESIAQSLADLEMHLEVPVANLSPEEQVRVKRDAVKALLDSVRSSLDRIGQVLDSSTVIASGDRPATPPPSSPASSSAAYQRACTGDPRAIARWLEASYKPQGVAVLATQKAQCLHVVLEFEGDRDPNQLADTVRENILELSLTSAARVKVHGREPGQKRPNWTRSFVL